MSAIFRKDWLNKVVTDGLAQFVARTSAAMVRLYGYKGPYFPPQWRHQMETFSALLAHCEENPTVTGGLPSQRLVTWSFDIFLDLLLNKRLSNLSRRLYRLYETPSRSFWRHCNWINIQVPVLSGWFIFYQNNFAHKKFRELLHRKYAFRKCH